MEVNYEIDGIRMVYRMPLEVDHHQAEMLKRQLDQLIDAYRIRELILDFSDTQFMDSSGIGVIIGRCRTLHFYDGTIYWMNLNGQIQKIFQAAGLHRIVKKWEGEIDAKQ